MYFFIIRICHIPVSQKIQKNLKLKLAMISMAHTDNGWLQLRNVQYFEKFWKAFLSHCSFCMKKRKIVSAARNTSLLFITWKLTLASDLISLVSSTTIDLTISDDKLFFAVFFTIFSTRWFVPLKQNELY